MEKYKEEFIEFMVSAGVLTFGDFTTKSGRKTPFFINTGNYKTGKQLSLLGDFYAAAIEHNFPEPLNALFGPAYKGIPLATAASISLFTKFNRNVGSCFNRKEAKDHGEGGVIVGYKPTDNDRILIIEDVTTAGTSIRETIPLLANCGKITIAGLIVSVDRMERGTGIKSALTEIQNSFGIKTAAIVNLEEIVSHLYNKPINGTIILTEEIFSRILDYKKLYGAQV